MGTKQDPRGLGDVGRFWFLSGLGDGRSADDDFSEVWPAQRGVRYVDANNVNFDVSRSFQT